MGSRMEAAQKKQKDRNRRCGSIGAHRSDLGCRIHFYIHQQIDLCFCGRDDIEGDEVTLTYLSYSHYNRDYAERYGYDSEKDSVYTDHIVKWDYKHGVLKTEWMDDLIIDKDGNIHKGKYTVLYKTDRPRPEPIDPATLEHPEGDPEYVFPYETEEEVEERADSIEEATEAAAAYAESKGAAAEAAGEEAEAAADSTSE